MASSAGGSSRPDGGADGRNFGRLPGPPRNQPRMGIDEQDPVPEVRASSAQAAFAFGGGEDGTHALRGQVSFPPQGGDEVGRRCASDPQSEGGECGGSSSSIGSVPTMWRTRTSTADGDGRRVGGGICTASTPPRGTTVAVDLHQEKRWRTSLEKTDELATPSSTSSELSSCAPGYRRECRLPRARGHLELPSATLPGLKVAYQGCPGAYSEAAAKKAYPNCQTVPCISEKVKCAMKFIEKLNTTRKVPDCFY